MEGADVVRRLRAAAPATNVTNANDVNPTTVATDGSREVHLAPRRSIYLEGDPAGGVYQIRRGCVMLTKLLYDGRRQVVEVLSTGDIFGFSPGPAYDCSAEALAATWCTVFDWPALEHSPALMRRLNSQLHRQLCVLHAHVTLLGRKSAMERMTSFLMRCIPERGGQNCPGPA